MSETPRTDLAQFPAIPELGRGSRYVVEADFARQLERELAQAEEWISNRKKKDFDEAMNAPVAELGTMNTVCRADGRCQYAIDHGAEGMGHCPDGQCSMPTRHLGPIDGNHANTALENWFPFSAEELKRARPDGMEFAAKICDGLANNMTHGDGPEHHADAARQCAREIRARIRRVP